MKEISNALSDTIITVCKKFINDAKLDKTYRCRVINKIASDKYTVRKDNVDHIVFGAREYLTDDIVYVLLPLNSWKDAIIVFP